MIQYLFFIELMIVSLPVLKGYRESFFCHYPDSYRDTKTHKITENSFSECHPNHLPS
jgi:hypothetical protein